MSFYNELPSVKEILSTASEASSADRAEALSRASKGDGLSLMDAALLLTAPDWWGGAIFETAKLINERVKGRVITFYGVVYIHDYCVNECAYCGDSNSAGGARTMLTSKQILDDVDALLQKHSLKEICFLMGEEPSRYSHDQLISDLVAVSEIYENKIILNIPPLSVSRFKMIKKSLKNKLHFRVFQETYDEQIYGKAHLSGPKKDIKWRIDAQSRALEAGFDEVGHGVLYGLNDKKNGWITDTLAMIAHARYLEKMYGKRSQSISFPRIQPAPGVRYSTQRPVTDLELMRCVSVVKLTEPNIDTVITCRETAAFRRKIRPIVNIEDFEARPGPGGNSMTHVRQQMFLPDMRSGVEVRSEIQAEGYTVK